MGSLAFHVYDVTAPGLLDRTKRLKAPDFLQFYTYGTLVNDGEVDRLYDASAHAEVARRVDPRLSLSAFRPNYSPVIAWAAAPLARLPFLQAMVGFTGLSVAAYFCAVALLARLTVLPGPATRALVILAAGWPTFYVLLRYGQLSAFSLVIVTLAVFAAARGTGVAAGVLLGLLAYKPNLLVSPILLLVLTRRWRTLSGLVMGASAELLLGLLLAGPAGMQSYIAHLVELARRPELVQFFPAESHSLRGLFRLLLPLPALVTAAGVAAIPWATWMAARVWRAHDDWRPRWAALVIAGLLASPHLLTYDLLLLAVPIVLIVDWLVGVSGTVPRGQWRWALLLLYFGAWPGTFIARLYHVQISTIGMLLSLWLLARAPRAGRS